MTDWRDDPEWQEWVENFRRTSLEAMIDSSMFLAIAPPDDLDVTFCAQLGASIMLEKPILVVSFPGQRVPPKLRALADRVVEADIDTEAGRERLRDAIESFLRPGS